VVEVTRVAWLADSVNGNRGGAELSVAEFAAAAPVGVEVVEVGADHLDLAAGCDRAVLHNVVSYPENTLRSLLPMRVTKFWHDTGPHMSPRLSQDIYEHANHIFCSPLQAAYMGFPDATCVPPALDLDPFRQAAENAGERRGSVTVGAWMNWGKSPERCREVAPDIDYYGWGPCSPAGTVAVEYEDVPELLARYRTFVHLPSVLEPFGRAVVEAWAAGCRVVVKNYVGARHWIDEAPDKLESAGEDFWRVVLGDA
jgi:hypothetical protein